MSNFLQEVQAYATESALTNSQSMLASLRCRILFAAFQKEEKLSLSLRSENGDISPAIVQLQQEGFKIARQDHILTISWSKD